jgi:hypothetical protein
MALATNNGLSAAFPETSIYTPPTDCSRFTDKDLVDACRRGDVQTIERYLDFCSKRRRSFLQQMMQMMNLGRKEPYDVTDEFSNRLIHIASQYGHTDLVETLIQHGAYIDSQNRLTGATPLHLAVIHGHLNTVEWLVRNGANIEAVDFLKRTPLHWAASENRLDMVQKLVELGADVNLTSRGKTAFDFCTDSRIKAYLFKNMDLHRRHSISPYDFAHRPSYDGGLQHHATISTSEPANYHESKLISSHIDKKKTLSHSY